MVSEAQETVVVLRQEDPINEEDASPILTEAQNHMKEDQPHKAIPLLEQLQKGLRITADNEEMRLTVYSELIVAYQTVYEDVDLTND